MLIFEQKHAYLSENISYIWYNNINQYCTIPRYGAKERKKDMSVDNMPKKGTYIALIVLGFLCGILWGCISLTQYKPMMAAVEVGDAETAWAKAKVIKIVTIVGVVVNILVGFAMSNQ